MSVQAMRRVGLGPGLVVALGLAALALRPVGPVAPVVAAAVGVAAVLSPVPEPAPSSAGTWAPAVLIGCAAVLAVGLGGATGVWPGGFPSVTAAAVAAVAEEAFFRRLVYGWLLRWGVAAAVIGSAVAFALVHVPAYGPLALPLNLAAGLLLGWQRWATGGWSAPAATHVLANLLAVGWLR